MKDNNDFKYLIQDTGHMFFGKELTYAEMMDREDVPFKFQAIIGSYFCKDTELSDRIIDHLCKMTKDEFSYRIYNQLKLNVRIFYKEEKMGLLGQKKDVWVHKSCKLQEFLQNYKEKVMRGEATVEEISISKLGLMTISI